MMLRIDHRESDDIDIFLPDPQLLPYLDPKLRDFEFGIVPSDYRGDGARFVKLAFENIGEIDFIIGRALTHPPTTNWTIEGEQVRLETVAEVITKKVHYRGANIKPRDIFDVAAAAWRDRDPIIAELRKYRDDVTRTRLALDRLNPDFVNATIADLAIRDEYRPIAETALRDAKDLLSSI